MFNDDERQWPDVPIEDEPGLPDEQDELELPGDDPFEDVPIDDEPGLPDELPGDDPYEDVPDDMEDVPEPLIDDEDRSLGASGGARASRDRQPGLSKDEFEEQHGSPTDRRQ